MSFTPHDPISADLRWRWLGETFAGERHIRFEQVLDDFDDESLGMEERTALWARFIKKKFPGVDVIVSSERYGEPLARHLGVRHVSFDLDRKRFPVSATLIRQHPFRYWAYIPVVVRPFFVKKVCFYGPESTGKSVLAGKMAGEFETEWVPEVARELITSNDFTVDDIIRIGHAQTRRVIEKSFEANKVLICDTDLITTEIYSRTYLHQVPPVLLELEKQITYDRYFLFSPDVPWVADGMRDLSARRQEMFELFKAELVNRGIPFTTVSGSYEQREETVRNEIAGLIRGGS